MMFTHQELRVETEQRLRDVGGGGGKRVEGSQGVLSGSVLMSYVTVGEGVVRYALLSQWRQPEKIYHPSVITYF